MKGRRPPIVAALLVLMLFGALSLARDATHTLTGAFVWNNEDRTGDLEAKFTESGDGTWDVAFRFEWEGKPRVFSGTAEGSLSDGKLSGEVQTESKEHTFVFAGRFAEGSFSGTHAAIGKDGEKRDTGTLTLER